MKDLFLALLNATLILIALCLVLALMVFNRANSLAESFAENLQIVTPLQESVRNTGAEVAALRSDLAGLKEQSGDVSSATMARVEARIETMEARLDEMMATLTELRGTPQRLLDQAIEKAGDQAVLTAGRIRGCVPPDGATTPSG